MLKKFLQNFHQNFCRIKTFCLILHCNNLLHHKINTNFLFNKIMNTAKTKAECAAYIEACYLDARLQGTGESLKECAKYAQGLYPTEIINQVINEITTKQ